MTPHPYRVVCQTRTATTLSYLSEWYPTWEAARHAQEQHLQGPWDSVHLLPPGQIPPRASPANRCWRAAALMFHAGKESR